MYRRPTNQTWKSFVLFTSYFRVEISLSWLERSIIIIWRRCAPKYARVLVYSMSLANLTYFFFAAAATAFALITEWPSWVTNEHFPTKESVEQLIIGLYLELLEMTYLHTSIFVIAIRRNDAMKYAILRICNYSFFNLILFTEKIMFP